MPPFQWTELPFSEIFRGISPLKSKTWLQPWLSLRTVFSDLQLWRHRSWSVTSHERGVLTSIVTSYSLIVLAHANWRKGDLHEWITTVNNDFSPHGIHSLACKNYGSGVIYMLFLVLPIDIENPYRLSNCLYRYISIYIGFLATNF